MQKMVWSNCNGSENHSAHRSLGTKEEQLKTRGIPSTSAHRITALVNPLPTYPIMEHREQPSIYPKEKKVTLRLHSKNNVNFLGAKNSNMDSVHMWVPGPNMIPP